VQVATVLPGAPGTVYRVANADLRRRVSGVTKDPSPTGAPPTGAAPPEAALLEDLTADLRTKVAEAWEEFGRALAAALPLLPEGASVEFTLDPTASGTDDAVYSVHVTSVGGFLTGLAVGNVGLPAAYRLSRAAVGDLVALGWSPPGVVDGSGDSFGLRMPVPAANRVAIIVTRTMKHVYGAPHPAFLTYAATAADHAPVHLPALGTARALLGSVGPPPGSVFAGGAGTGGQSAGAMGGGQYGGAMGGGGPEGAPSGGHAGGGHQAGAAPGTGPTGRGTATPDPAALLPLGERVQLVVARLLKTQPDQLQVDADGDIGIRAGSAMVFVRVRDNPPLIDVFSPVLTEIEPTERLYGRLSELTNRMPIGRLYCTNDTVWASVPVMGRDFQPSHLMLAVQVMTGLADELDDRLQGEFGGKRFYGDADKAASSHRASNDERTGMYL
jgi:hypothetical protein